MRFHHKTAVITGGGSGIGEATARAFAAEGGNVVVADINGPQAMAVAASISQAGGIAIAVKGDVTNISDAARIANVAVDSFGSIHFLCCSAGLQTYGTVETTDEETWDRTLGVNLKGMYLMAKYCIPQIRRQGGGAVVNITSVQAIQTQKNVSAYAASKAGVIALSKSMAMDYARENIRVNCICPGSIDTPLLRFGAAQHGPLDEVLAAWGDQHPIGRIGKAEEIAKTVLFLFSDDAAFILGQAIVVDGGLTSRLL
ncbi:MAG: SDR family oxidoreductase [Bacteroidia bacterium]